MERSELTHAIEAVLFAAAEPVTLRELAKIFDRAWAEEPEERRVELKSQLEEVFAELSERARAEADPRGFTLVQVADGLTFRSNPRFAHVLRAMRDERPQRLSQAALETLAIVAYRQPVTKPEVDDIRGVDCGATLRLLLDRNLVRIVGKKDEPGRPMLYATTKEFLSFFNLGNLAQLPTLREFHELTPDSVDELKTFEEQNPSLKELSDSARKMHLEEEPAVAALDDAMAQLSATETAARDALAAEGISITGEPLPVEGGVTTPAEEPSAPISNDEPERGV
jgi:segregation and condensation protein B